MKGLGISYDDEVLRFDKIRKKVKSNQLYGDWISQPDDGSISDERERVPLYSLQEVCILCGSISICTVECSRVFILERYLDW